MSANTCKNESAYAVDCDYFNEIKTIDEGVDMCASVFPNNGYCFSDMAGEEQNYSFRELKEAVGRSASYLSNECGLSKGDVVVLITDLPKDFVIVFLACVKLGVIPVPMANVPYADNSQDENRLKEVIALCRCAAILCDDGMSKAMQNFSQRMASIVPVYNTCGQSDLAVTYPVHLPDDIVYLQLTSGTTSSVKAVVATHRTLLSNTRGIMGANGLQMEPGKDVGLTWLPLYHDMGLVGFLICTILTGVKCVFIPTKRFLRRPGCWLDMLAKHKANTTYGPNFSFYLIDRLVKEKDLAQLDLSHIKAMGCGAEPIDPQLIAQFTEKLGRLTGFPDIALKPSYGLAESTLCVTMTPMEEGFKTAWIDENESRENQRIIKSDPESENTVQVISCGTLVDNSEVAIVDEERNIVEEGVKGEIAVYGESVAKGYFRNTDDTQAVFRDGWLYTGDIGFVLDGELYVTGRKKELIIANGKNYSPHEIEWCVEQLAGIRKGSVIAFSATEKGVERIYILIGVRNYPGDSIENDVKNIVFKYLKLPVAGIVVQSPSDIPKTSSGKLKRTLVKKRFIEGYYQPLAH